MQLTTRKRRIVTKGAIHRNLMKTYDSSCSWNIKQMEVSVLAVRTKRVRDQDLRNLGYAGVEHWVFGKEEQVPQKGRGRCWYIEY